MNNNSTEKSRGRYLRYLFYVLPIIAIVGGYGLLVVATQESPPLTIITGTSMQPTILPGSVALITKVPFNQLKVGDIIVFEPQVALSFPCNSAPSSSLTSETPVPCYVIHRIVLIQNDSQGGRIVQTKGDNNQYSIPGYDTNINSSMYLGKVVLLFPLVGYVTVPPYNEYIALAILIVLFSELILERRESKRNKQQLRTEQPLVDQIPSEN